jgi:hypothetical protein
MTSDDFQPPVPGEPDPYAPKIPEGFLDNLKGMVMRKMRNGHRTKHVPVEDQPNRFCKICTATRRSDVILAGNEIQPEICPRCRSEIDKGQIAIVVPQTPRHCFVFSVTLANAIAVGQDPIIEVSPSVFDLLEKEHKIQKDLNDQKNN